MKPLLERLQSGEILVADGAMGTMLMERGLKPGDCPEAVNLASPEVLEEIAALYLGAGADLVQTNTFGGSPLKLAAYALDGKCEEINKAGVAAVRKAVGDRAYVSASIGPSGKLLQPYGDAAPEQLAESFIRQAKALAEAGADIICVETMTATEEAEIAVNAAKGAKPGIPVMATMTFDKTKKGYRTMMGVSVEQAVEALERAGADILGSNCGNGVENMVEIAREFRRHTKKPLLIQSNAGLPVIEGIETVYKETPDYMAERISGLVKAGVSIIGGCCGTTPAHIAAFRKAVLSTRGPV